MKRYLKAAICAAALALCAMPNAAWAADYYWNGGNEAELTTTKTLDSANNWCTDAKLTTAAEAAPGSGDTAHFTANSTAKVAGGTTFEAAIDVAAGISVTLKTESKNSTGTLSGTLTVAEGATVKLLAYNNTATTLTFTGKLLGTGTVNCAKQGSGSDTVNVSGADLSEFQGTLNADVAITLGAIAMNDGAITLSSSTSITLGGDITGSGFLRLNGATIKNTTGSTTRNISVPLEIVDDTVNTFDCGTGSTQTCRIQISAAMTGGGTLYCKARTAYSCVQFNYVPSDFTGKVYAWHNTAYSPIRFLSGATGVSNKTWDLSNSSWYLGTEQLGEGSDSNAISDSSSNGLFNGYTTGTYKFGALCAKWNNVTKNYLEIGSKDEDCTITGDSWNSSSTVTWVAPSATLTFGVSTSSCGTLTLNGDGKVLVKTKSPSYINVGSSVNGYFIFSSDNSDIATDIFKSFNSLSSALSLYADEAVNISVTEVKSDSYILSGKSFYKAGSGKITLSGAFTKLSTIRVLDGTLEFRSSTSGISYTHDSGTAGVTSTDDTEETYKYVYTFTPETPTTIAAADSNGIVSSGSITVPAYWIEAVAKLDAAASGLASTLVTDRSTGNGYSYLACYALGLDPADATSIPKVTITTDSSGNFVIGLDGVTLASNVSVTLSVKSTTDISDANSFVDYTEASESGSGVGTTFTITPSSVSNVEFFKIAIDISGV